ncbi:MAG: hypothetical protein HKN45_03190 [Flavobacteriales bacterium]|nr:hypothetical protein [Flavobacteriales bacterium]
MKNKELNISTYEEWFIDHLDGNLTKEEGAELEAFLILHPELAEELDGMEALNLEASEIAFPEKEILLMPSQEELRLMNIAEEGSLADLQALNEKQVREVASWKNTVLSPDLSIQYPEQSKLLKEESAPIIPLWILRVAVAASVIGVVLAIFFKTSEITYSPREGLAQEEEISVDELLRADYTEFIYEGPEVVEEVVIPVMNQEPSSEPLIAKEQEVPAPMEIEIPSLTLNPEIEFAQELDSTDTDSFPLVAEDESPELEKVQDAYPQNDALATIEGNAKPIQQTGSVKEYSSVVDFLKDKVVKTAEDKELLAMDDVSEEDQFIRTSFRIGGIEFSRLKKRK